MKILMVTETYPPEINGVALTIEAMINSLLRLGHHVLLVRPRQPGTAPQSEGLALSQVRSLPLPRYNGLRLGLTTPSRVTAMLNDFQPHAAYLATEGPLGWAALRAAKRSNIPVLSGYHTRFDQYVNFYGFGVIQRTAAAYLRRFHNASSGTLVPTQGLQQFLQQCGYQNVQILERAVDKQRFNPRFRSQQRRQEWGLDEQDLAVLHVGRLAPEKNLDLAVKSFRAIQIQHPRARMVMVGDGPDRRRLQVENPDIVFTGMQSGQRLSELYASADLFLFPSVTDTFGNVVLEALASGLPVLSFDYAAAADFVQHGESGFLAPMHHDETFVANARVLANICLHVPELRKKARDSINHLEPDQVASRLVDLFRRSSPPLDSPEQAAA